LNGLRVPEATSADIEHLGLERGHRTLTITRKVVTVPLTPRTALAIAWPSASVLAARCS
jgi:integrase